MKNVENLINPPSSDSKEFSSLVASSMQGLKQYYLLVSAWELGIFEHTVSPLTYQELAQQMGSHEIMTKLFCEALSEIGMLTKKDDKYSNSPLASNYLVPSSYLYKTKTLEMLEKNAKRWANLSKIIKEGPIERKRTAMFGGGRVIRIAESGEAGSVFNVIDVAKKHLDIQRWRKIIDVGGGHGLYAIAFSALNPKLEAFVFDQPHVTPITTQYIDNYNAKKVHVISGDYNKDSIGKGYDAIFSSFNQTCSDPKFIPIFFEALNPSGDLILRRHKEKTHVDPLQTLDWNLVHFEGRKLGVNPHYSGKFIRKAEYIKRLEEAGFSVHANVPVDEGSELIFARKPLP
ncbi:MAG: methyltransferase [archaeon]